MAQQCFDLGRFETRDVFGVVGLFAFEEQQIVGPVMRYAVLAEEMRITRRDHTVAGPPAAR